MVEQASNKLRGSYEQRTRGAKPTNGNLLRFKNISDHNLCDKPNISSK